MLYWEYENKLNLVNFFEAAWLPKPRFLGHQLD